MSRDHLSPEAIAISTSLNTVLYGPLAPPAPNVYRDVPEVEYHRWEAASNSRLNILKHSPAHLRWALDNPEQDETDTDAKTVGSALHCRLFTPGRFDAAYKCGPMGDGRFKQQRDAKAALQAKYPDATLLRASDYANVMGMWQALQDHPITSKVLAHAEAFEVSAVWECEGVTCKARADILAPALRSIFDLKKVARDASPGTFARSLVEYGYIRQAPFYLDAFNQVGSAFYENFAFIVIEEQPPHGICVFQLDPEDIERGRESYRALLRTYAQCLQSGVWPGLPSVVQWISLPGWARAELEA